MSILYRLTYAKVYILLILKCETGSVDLKRSTHTYTNTEGKRERRRGR